VKWESGGVLVQDMIGVGDSVQKIAMANIESRGLDEISGRWFE